MLTRGLPEDVDGLAHSRQGPEGVGGWAKNPRREPGPTGIILGLILLSKWHFGHLASVSLRNPLCLPSFLSCPGTSHSPTDTPAESAPAGLGTLLAHLLPVSCTAGH